MNRIDLYGDKNKILKINVRFYYDMVIQSNGLHNLLFIVPLTLLYNTTLILIVSQNIVLEIIFRRKCKVIKSSLKFTWNHFGTNSIQAIVSMDVLIGPIY